MTAPVAKKYWSDNDLLALPKRGQKSEIIGGELVMSPASSEHGALIMRIAGPLYTFVAKTDLGVVLDGQTGCRMKSDDLICPDVSFVCSRRWKAHRRQKTAFFQGGPDLVVEVLSPGDTIAATREKLQQCLAEGTRLAWVIHPRTRRVYVYRADGHDSILKATDSLDGEEVIPGFSLKVSSLFQ